MTSGGCWGSARLPKGIPAPRVLHPYPLVRFLATHPRWEPYGAVKPVDGLAGESPASADCLVGTVVISGDGAGDQSVESPEVNVLVGWMRIWSAPTGGQTKQQVVAKRPDRPDRVSGAGPCRQTFPLLAAIFLFLQRDESPTSECRPERRIG